MVAFRLFHILSATSPTRTMQYYLDESPCSQFEWRDQCWPQGIYPFFQHTQYRSWVCVGVQFFASPLREGMKWKRPTFQVCFRNWEFDKSHVTAPHINLNLARGSFRFFRNKFVSSCRYFDPIHSYDLTIDDKLGVNISRDGKNRPWYQSWTWVYTEYYSRT